MPTLIGIFILSILLILLFIYVRYLRNLLTVKQKFFIHTALLVSVIPLFLYFYCFNFGTLFCIYYGSMIPKTIKLFICECYILFNCILVVHSFLFKKTLKHQHRISNKFLILKINHRVAGYKSNRRYENIFRFFKNLFKR
jgi:hypothetical protein